MFHPLPYNADPRNRPIINFSYHETQLPQPTYEVRTLPERAHRRIHWPNVIAYRAIERPVEIAEPFVLANAIPPAVITGPASVINTEQPHFETQLFQIAQLATELAVKHQDPQEMIPIRRAHTFINIMRQLMQALNSGHIRADDPATNEANNTPEIRMTQQELAQILAENQLPHPKDPEQLHLPVTEEPHLLSTGYITPYRTSKALHLETTKSELNIAPCDNQWECLVALTLDLHPRVHAWARNYSQDWRIPYMHQGRWHGYRPDFVARLDHDEDPIMLVIEVKGQYWPHDPVKVRYANDYWIPAVNNDPHFAELGHWQYAFIEDPYHTRTILDRISA